ncbi:hypothetical protein NPIL_614151 [Nephila pilipes]|uniref:Uncharacterized protein n=1 Tax=Nephila pilipes TaxID=299642 RepID=A0A8X6PHT5_NEPPI|nr:hypothetical protein NPIL_614151 [Nephila pilipes]
MASTSTDRSLLYSEYLESDPTKHVLEILEHEKKKPEMTFRKSLMLPKMMDLITRLKEDEEKLNAKPEKERNIEDVDEDSAVIKMSVTINKEESDDDSLTKGVVQDEPEESSDSESDMENTDINKSDKDISEHCRDNPEESSILMKTEEIIFLSSGDCLNNKVDKLHKKSFKRKVVELIDPELDQTTKQKICVLE